MEDAELHALTAKLELLIQRVEQLKAHNLSYRDWETECPVLLSRAAKAA